MRQKITAGKIWGIIYPVLTYTAVTFVIMFFMTFLITFLKMTQGGGNEINIEQFVTDAVNSILLEITMISAIATIPLMILFMRRDIANEKLNNRYIKYERVGLLKYLLIIPFALFNMLWANMFVSLLQLVMPKFMISSYDSTAETIYGGSFILQLFAAGIICPIVEELIFRGLIYKRLTRISSITVAALISSAFFGIYHGNWIQAPYAFIIGMVCVFVYQRYQSIKAPCLLHISANTIAVLISATAGAADTTEQTTESISNIQMLMMGIPTIIIFGSLALLLAYCIKKTVNPKEISE